MTDKTVRPFLGWFQKHGGTIDTTAIDITTFPSSEGGRGAVALKDIPECQTLFTVPRSLILSTRTSALPQLLGAEAWQAERLDEGWAGLILCMMWEAARREASLWCGYMEMLPSRFDTPMFWDERDLNELEGTSVVEKLGREEAERDYREKLLPAVKSRPDLFPERDSEHYSLEKYHLMGSRILSRSFVVEKWEGDDAEEENVAANDSLGSGMDVDSPKEQDHHGVDENGDVHDVHDADDEEDKEEASNTALVPMADILNARYGAENAKLFYERNELRLVSTKPIKCGEQIWNTYGDLPNSELLRRYGHVDILPLPHGQEGNPGDVVEVKADVLVIIVRTKYPGVTLEEIQEKIDWWLEEGGDDVFVFEYDCEIPPAFISLARLLLNADEWERAKEKGNPPKPKMDSQVLEIVRDVLLQRLGAFPTTLEDDEQTLRQGVHSLNKKHSLVVRIGEKRILRAVLLNIGALLEKEKAEGINGSKTKTKRKGEHPVESVLHSSKKTKR